ncbi:hypothetical protein [Micromonospora sp. HK10]|uniref:hypothetical protein n=1 Tax=Micromonospora sp. HK10 TaxID=1538294 RepID=UPI0012E22B64|nr:hypothetical protein [Micromonospora sp. HK10]
MTKPALIGWAIHCRAAPGAGSAGVQVPLAARTAGTAVVAKTTVMIAAPRAVLDVTLPPLVTRVGRQGRCQCAGLDDAVDAMAVVTVVGCDDG